MPQVEATQSRWLKARRRAIISTKYILAVLLSLHVTAWFGVVDYLSASFVAVLTLQPNLYRGLNWSWEQLVTTTLGASVTWAVLFAGGGELSPTWWTVQAAIAMGITIYLCLRFDMGDASTIAVFTVVYLTCLPQMIPDQGFVETFHLRYATILIGIGTATLINYGSSLFRYSDRMNLNLREIIGELTEALENLNTQLRNNDRKDANLQEPMTCLRDTFGRIHDVEIDLEQLSREAEWKATRVRQEQVGAIRSRLLLVKNMTHHAWSIVLNLIHEEHSQTSLEELRQGLSQRIQALETLLDELDREGHATTSHSETYAQPEAFAPEIRFLDDNLDELIESFRNQSPEEGNA